MSKIKMMPNAALRVVVRRSHKLSEDWWIKYIGCSVHPLVVADKLPDLFTHWDFDQPTSDRLPCSHFNCGRTQTLRENLFGTTCIDHNPANYLPTLSI